ncbi:hypothetical protein [uncultured Lacinutrix sp.]|uniref:hypothetical protein n=1 Tax=uncultured Lacinutrix sp. TaxID=574032 RepID=UPI0026115EA7|nr:hypothetical protein [uncultured Lacinutrix sp.]
MKDLNDKIDELLSKVSEDVSYTMEGQHNFVNQEDYVDYRRVLVTLLKENLISKPLNNDHTFHVTSYGNKVIKDGGWKKFTENNINREKQKELKENLDLRISQFQVKTKWLPYWVSGISLIISLYALIASSNLVENKNEESLDLIEENIKKKTTIDIDSTIVN